MDRRHFIRTTAGGIVAAAAIGSTGACSSAYPPAAVEPWRGPRAGGDARRFALAFAILAPNPHNLQPWLVDLSQANEIRLYVDRARLLPQTDPWSRQILIGHGAFLELLAMSLAERGYAASVRLFPEGAFGDLPDARPVAIVHLDAREGIPRDPLFARILDRRTSKQAYASDRAVPTEAVGAILDAARPRAVLAGVVTDPARVGELRRIAREAYVAEVTTARTYLESARLFRIGPSEIDAHRDGIALNGAMVRTLDTVGLFSRTEVPVPGSSLYTRTMERWSAFETGTGFLWIATAGNDRPAQIEVGRAFVRAQLAATSLGVGVHPLSQALQEFPEVAPQRAALHRALGFDPERVTVQMLSRFGYAPATQPSPRRGVDAIVRR